MKKTILSLSLFLATITLCSAQEIRSQKVFGGYKFTQEGKTLKMGDLVQIIKVDPQSFEYIKKARTNSTFGSIFAFAGGALIGWPIGRAIAGGDANWALAGIGAGLIGVSIPFSKGANKNAKHAVDLYNSSEGTSSNYEFKPEFGFTANQNGVGLVMNF